MKCLELKRTLCEVEVVFVEMSDVEFVENLGLLDFIDSFSRINSNESRVLRRREPFDGPNLWPQLKKDIKITRNMPNVIIYPILLILRSKSNHVALS